MLPIKLMTLPAGPPDVPPEVQSAATPGVVLQMLRVMPY
jgi:hypothetical protein